MLQFSSLWSNDQEADGASGTIPRLQMLRVYIGLAFDQTVKLHGLSSNPLQEQTQASLPIPQSSSARYYAERSSRFEPDNL